MNEITPKGGILLSIIPLNEKTEKLVVAELQAHIRDHAPHGKKAEVMAHKETRVTEENLEEIAKIIKLASEVVKAYDGGRKHFADPLNKLSKLVQREFKERHIDPVSDIGKRLKREYEIVSDRIRFREAQEKLRAEREARELQDRLRQEQLEAAAALENDGLTEDAEAVLAMADKIQVPAAPTQQTNTDGHVVKKRIEVEVEGIGEFVEFIVKHYPQYKHMFSVNISEVQKFMKTQAALDNKKVGYNPPGIKARWIGY